MKTPMSKLLDQMENHDGCINAALITNPEDVEYYSGFRGNGAVLFVHSLVRYLFVTDCDDDQRCKVESSGFKILSASWEEAANFLSQLCNKLGVHSIWIEEKHINKEEYRLLKESLDGVELIPGDDFISKTINRQNYS